MAALPRAILFDLDDTLIRAYAQPEEAWTRLLHVFAAHLDAHDRRGHRARARGGDGRGARLLERPRRSRQMAARTFPAPAGSRCAAAWPSSAAPTTRWPTASPMPSPSCAATNTGSIPTPTPRSMRCATPASGSPSSPTAPPRPSAPRSSASSSPIASTTSRSRASSARASPSSPSTATRWSGWACAAGEAWMVGDNYEWEVVAPQQLGMCGIWYDPFGAGVPGPRHRPADAHHQAARRTGGMNGLAFRSPESLKEQMYPRPSPLSQCHTKLRQISVTLVVTSPESCGPSAAVDRD